MKFGMKRALSPLQGGRGGLVTATAGAPPHREDARLSSLRMTRLLSVIWSPTELETLRPRIVERSRRAPIGRMSKQILAEEAFAAAAC